MNQTSILKSFKPFDESMTSDPYGVYKEARTAAPVFYSADIDHWVVSRFADVKRIFLDHEQFSATNSLTPVTPVCPAAIDATRGEKYSLLPALGNQDRPGHTRFRANLMRILPPKALRDEEPRARAIFRQLLDQIEGKGKAELIDELIFQFPARVILHVLGFSEDLMPILIAGGKNRNQLIWGRPSDSEQIQIATGVADLLRHCRELVEERTAAPQDDLTSQLVLLEDEDGEHVFNVEEISNVLFAFFTAGHETTSSMIGNALLRLLSDPGQWQKLCTDSSLIPNAVEESLRFDSSVVAWRRLAKTDVEVSGVTIPMGSQVLLLIGAANRDNGQFDEADRLDLARSNADAHLSFGKGVHNCYGNALARVEIRVALEELTRRLPRMRLAADQEFKYMPNLAFRTLKSLHVEWD